MKQPTSEQESYERWRRLAMIAWAVIGFSVIAFASLYLIFNLSSVLQPFIYAGAIVYILRPSVDFLEGRGISRLLAIFLIYLIVILIISVILLFIIPVIIDEAQLLVKLAPTYIQSGQKLFNQFQDEFARLPIPKEGYSALDSLVVQLRHAIINFFSKIPQTTVSVFGGLLNILLAPVIALYLLKDMRHIRQGAINLMPKNRQEEFAVVLSRIDKVLGGFIRGQMTVALIVGVMLSIGLAVLQIDFALIIGIFAGFFNLIPYMGPVFGAIPAIFLAIVKFNVWRALAVIVVFAFVQILDNILITPNVMRQHVGLPPVLVIFSLLTGGVFLGLLGMLIAIPTVAAAKAIIDYLLEKRAS